MKSKTVTWIVVGGVVLLGLYWLMSSKTKLTGTSKTAATGGAAWLSGAGALATGVSNLVDSFGSSSDDSVDAGGD
jgi:hypothetical protein